MSDESKPTNPGEPELRPHEYDGIQEYDQKLPNWWLFTFYIAILWMIIHWLAYYQFHLIPTDEEKIGRAIQKIENQRAEQLRNIDDTRLWTMSQDPAVISAGEATYKATCVACHGPDLMGKKSNPLLPGLALADNAWKHGHTPTDVLKIVRRGSPDVTKGMPPWEPQLGTQRVVEVVAYIMSHHKEGEAHTEEVN
ncbi:cytochrome c oxidase cbb3-type subunit 3 [Roseimicrobium gellanilyticum]|uniref:Cytochrome c oxidase cbb3-type subunit 3 n=1 Tax=Roseimicrobium gellanilyticum TaxID=748857 RepID=A0A366HU77_9BACT|nr:cbb3-type cytochrome c oxidase N-terminal domain-containing protein [Roseimicrobium gellanilyticum]RBP46464.1 cytochrome c oxidase cbb3-type subunit 3 [Roseimicrobium gellanilyticum]